MNIKTVSVLVSMAFLSVVAYIFALFGIPTAHAADLIISDKLAIDAGALKPLHVDVKSDVDVKASAGSEARVEAKAETKNEARVVSPTPTSTVESKTEVSSTTDLDAFTRDLTSEDDNVTNVKVTEDAVAVSYKEPARIFGLIPTEVMVTVVAHNDGTVTVKYPWYAFLAGKNSGSLKPGLQQHIGDILKSAQVSATSTASATTTAEISPELRAKLIHAIHGALKAYRANATTTVDAAVGI